MNENGIQVFMNEVFGEIRILEQNDGKVLFCGKDVANSLNYASTANAIAAHCKGVTEIMTPTNGGDTICRGHFVRKNLIEPGYDSIRFLRHKV